MSDQPVAGWTPMTMWNVGRIGGKQMIRFEDSFSTSGARSMYQATLSRPYHRPTPAQATPEPTYTPRTPRFTRNRPGRPTVDQLRSRYNI